MLKRIIPITIGIVASAGVAVAAFIVATAVSGTVTTGDFAMYLNSGVSAVTNDSSTCTVAQTSATELSVVWDGGIEGSECVITAPFQGLTSNARPAVLEGVSSLPAGVSGMLDTDCGVVIDGAATVAVTLRLVIDSAAAPSTVYGLNGARFVWVPAGTESLAGCV